MHPVLEQIKQSLAPRWYKLQKSVVEFVKQFLVPKLRELQKYMVKFAKQFLVPKWHELQKYMLDFKERMTMKRMVVMCLLLVAVVCGILALAQGDGKQDWEKEPYPFEVEYRSYENNEKCWIASSKLPVTVVDGKGNESYINWGIGVSNLYGFSWSMGWPLSWSPIEQPDQLDGYDASYVVVEFSNGQKNSLRLDFALPPHVVAGLEFNASYSFDSEETDFISMCRSYDIVSVRCFYYCLNRSSDLKELEVLKFRFKDFNSAATINAMLNDIEKKSGSDSKDIEFGKVLTKGSSSSKPSSVQSNKSVSTDADDDEEEIDSVFVEKSIVIKSVETQHNVVQNGQKGMNIIVNYSVEGMKGKTGGLNAYFYFEDGTPLKDGNKSSVPYYGLDNGNVAVGKQFTPRYDDVAMSGTLFMPYDELHLRKGKFSLKYYCAIFDDDIKLQATSDWQYFTVTQQ